MNEGQELRELLSGQAVDIAEREIEVRHQRAMTNRLLNENAALQVALVAQRAARLHLCDADSKPKSTCSKNDDLAFEAERLYEKLPGRTA